MINILIVDDHPIVREGIQTTLNGNKKFNVVDAVSSAKEALAIIKIKKVDLLLSDISMPEINGIQLAEMTKKISSKIKILFLTMYDNEAYVKAGLGSGGNGYLLKDSEKAELEEAILKVMNGEKFLGKSVFQSLNKKVNEDFEINKTNISVLSQREEEILNLIAHGLNNKEIAVKLFISNRTVDAHRYNIMQKMKVKNTAELIKHALKLNLVKF